MEQTDIAVATEEEESRPQLSQGYFQRLVGVGMTECLVVARANQEDAQSTLDGLYLLAVQFYCPSFLTMLYPEEELTFSVSVTSRHDEHASNRLRGKNCA